MKQRSLPLRRTSPVRGASRAAAPGLAFALVLFAFPSPVLAEQARGIDDAFFAAGGALDQQLPAELATAPAAQPVSADAAGVAGAAAQPGVVPGEAAQGPAAVDQVVAAAAASPGADPNQVPPAGDPGIPLGADDLANSGFRLFVGLGIVVALIYGINALLRRTRLPLVVGSGLVRRLATEALGPNQAINILDVSGKVIVVGVTDKGMTMLTELQGEAADRARLTYTRAASESAGPGGRGSFGRALRQFTGHWLGGRLEPESSPAPGMDGTRAPQPSFASAAGRGHDLVSGSRPGPEPRSVRRGRGAFPAQGAPASGERGAIGFDGVDAAGSGRPAAFGSGTLADDFGAPDPGAFAAPAAGLAQERRRRLDERAATFLAQQQDRLRGLSM